MWEQVLFIVWRESVEAILIVGIVYAWLKQADSRIGLRYLWLGVLAGLGLAGVVGAALMQADSWLQGDSQDIFQATMVLIACALIVQMVLWMRVHARHLKRELHEGLESAVKQTRFWGIAVLVAIAVAREGSETVVFLYGMGMAQLQMGGLWSFISAAACGFGLALVTFFLMQLGSRVFSWKWFFRVTEILLLLLACSLLISGVEKLMGLGALPTGMDPLWDTSAWLDDSAGLGGLLATFAGYRAWPAETMVIAFGLYWVTVLGLLFWQKRRQQRLQVASQGGI